MECVKCLIPLGHPFGVYFNKDGICSGCLSFEKRKNDLPHWDNSELINDIGMMLSKEIAFCRNMLLFRLMRMGNVVYFGRS